MAPGGSSSVLSNAGAARAPRCTSVTITTWRAAWSGRRWARRDQPVDIGDAEHGTGAMDDVEIGVAARPSAARQVRHVPHPPSGHRSAAAKPWAATRPPFPRHPGRGRREPGRAAARAQSGHRLLLANHVGEERRAAGAGCACVAHAPGPAGRRVVRARRPGYGCQRGAIGGAVDHGPVRRIGRGVGQEAVAHPWAKAGPRRSSRSGAGRGQPGRGHVDRDVDQDREVRRQPGGGPGHQLASSAVWSPRP